MFDRRIRTTAIALCVVAMAAGAFTLACAARNDAPTGASAGEATVGGAVTAVDGSRVTIREARSRAQITIEFEKDVEGIAAVRAGDCVLASGRWKNDSTFIATRIDSVRPGCR